MRLPPSFGLIPTPRRVDLARAECPVCVPVAFRIEGNRLVIWYLAWQPRLPPDLANPESLSRASPAPTSVLSPKLFGPIQCDYVGSRSTGHSREWSGSYAVGHARANAREIVWLGVLAIPCRLPSPPACVPSRYWNVIMPSLSRRNRWPLIGPLRM